MEPSSLPSIFFSFNDTVETGEALSQGNTSMEDNRLTVKITYYANKFQQKSQYSKCKIYIDHLSEIETKEQLLSADSDPYEVLLQQYCVLVEVPIVAVRCSSQRRKRHIARQMKKSIQEQLPLLLHHLNLNNTCVLCALLFID